MAGLAIDISRDGWIEALGVAQRGVVQELLAAGRSPEEVAEVWLSQAGSQTNAGFGAGTAIQAYFANVQAEFVAFVCDDPRYEDERKQALTLWEGGGKPALIT